MYTRSFYQFSGAAAILSALLYIISITGMLAYFEGDLSNPALFAANMVNQSAMMLIYGWPGLIATILIVPVVMTINVPDQQQSLSKFIRIIALIGLSFILIGYLFQLALTYYIAPIMLEASTEEASFGPFLRGIIGVQDMFWLNGDLLAFAGIGLLLLTGLKHGQFPRWLSIIGIVSGVVAAVGSFSFIPSMKESIIAYFFLAGFSVFAVWEVIAGIYLFNTNNHDHD